MQLQTAISSGTLKIIVWIVDPHREHNGGGQGVYAFANRDDTVR